MWARCAELARKLLALAAPLHLPCVMRAICSACETNCNNCNNLHAMRAGGCLNSFFSIVQSQSALQCYSVEQICMWACSQHCAALEREREEAALRWACIALIMLGSAARFTRKTVV